MQYTGILKKYNKATNELTIKLDTELNIEHIKTMYSDLRSVQMDLEVTDPRIARPKQRALYYALLNDIQESLVVPQDYLDEYFRGKYTALTFGDKISLKKGTESTVSEAKLLLDIVIDFMFEWNIPFKTGYQLLPKNESYYLYKCIKHRKCAECGKYADIHHEKGRVGSGRNRNTFDHTNSTFIALCREHHNELHNSGGDVFMSKYHLYDIKVNPELLVKLEVMRKTTFDRLNEQSIITKMDGVIYELHEAT